MCDVLDNMFNDVTEFEQYTVLLSEELASKIKICKVELNETGDDNLAKAFGIDE